MPDYSETMKPFLESGRSTLQQQGAAITALSEQLDDAFADAVAALMHGDGHVVTSGVGKSGLVARKIAATFSSIGVPSVFLHPTDALHGDLGMVGARDVLLLLSKSGETDELVRLHAAAHRRCAGVVVMVGQRSSSLGRLANVTIEVAVPAEAGPLHLAPTTSTTAMMAMGDALAVALMEARGLDAERFAAVHPAGSLGRQLAPVSAHMVCGDLPIVTPTVSLRQVITTMNRGRLGLAVVCNAQRHIHGLITDGDLRRALGHGPDPLQQQAQAIMTQRPHWIAPGERMAVARECMNRNRITALLVSEDGVRLEGILHLHHLDAHR